MLLNSYVVGLLHKERAEIAFFFLPGNSAEYGFWVGLKIQVGLITSDFRWG